MYLMGFISILYLEERESGRIMILKTIKEFCEVHNISMNQKRWHLKGGLIPTPGDDDLLVKVRSVGICGSDVAYYFGMSSLETSDGKGPLILGHEFTGEVIEVGSNAEGAFMVGDRVVVNPVQSNPNSFWSQKGLSNLCTEKRILGVGNDGGFAEYHEPGRIQPRESLSTSW